LFLNCTVAVQSQRERETRRQQEMQEEAMAAEMERLKMEEKRDTKLRQQIRESRYGTAEFVKSSQVKLPLVKTSDNRTSFTNTMNENKIVKNQYTIK